MSQYERHSITTIEEVVGSIPNRTNNLPLKKIINGVSIKMTSERYLLFSEKGCDCVKCGIKGAHFAIEKIKGSANVYHLNLYAVDTDGNEILMTKDHIIPKSKGGSNQLENYQPMCSICNRVKGNIL